MRKEDIKPFVWGVVAGAIVLLIVIFSTGWVVTSSSAKAKSELMSEKAVLDHLAPICVEQFMQDPNKEERLKELKELDSWKRDDYVKERGWATMPGSKSPVPEIAEECAKRVMELKQ